MRDDGLDLAPSRFDGDGFERAHEVLGKRVAVGRVLKDGLPAVWRRAGGRNEEILLEWRGSKVSFRVVRV